MLIGCCSYIHHTFTEHLQHAWDHSKNYTYNKEQEKKKVLIFKELTF